MSQFLDDNVLNRRSVMPWAEKYRPDLMNQIVSHETILRILKNQIAKRNLSNTIFYGPPGTGKTTTIHAMARNMFGENFMNNILELNGSNDRGINVVRERVDAFAQHEIQGNKRGIQKLVILDEADSMTIDAQTTLQTVIEKYVETTRFCLICNYNTKIINSLRSLCTIFNFETIPDNLHTEHLKKIIEFESMSMDDDALYELVRISKGDLRQSINVLQSLCMIYKDKNITTKMLYDNICQIQPNKMKKMIDVLFNPDNDFNDIVDKLMDMSNKESLNVSEIINIITEYVRTNDIFDNIELANVFTGLEQIERNICMGSTPEIQLYGIASTIYKSIK